MMMYRHGLGLRTSHAETVGGVTTVPGFDVAGFAAGGGFREFQSCGLYVTAEALSFDVPHPETTTIATTANVHPT